MEEPLSVTVTELGIKGHLPGVVEVTDWLRVFGEFTAIASGPAIPYDVLVEARYEDGQFRVLTLTATRRDGGDAVSTEGLRKVPVGRILAQALGSLVNDWDAQSGYVKWGKDGPKLVARPEGPDEKAIRTVTSLYRLAHMVGLPPTAYVAETLKLSKSTAGRWVAMARKKGQLGPAVGTKAGEG